MKKVLITGILVSGALFLSSCGGDDDNGCTILESKCDGSVVKVCVPADDSGSGEGKWIVGQDCKDDDLQCVDNGDGNAVCE